MSITPLYKWLLKISLQIPSHIRNSNHESRLQMGLFDKKKTEVENLVTRVPFIGKAAPLRSSTISSVRPASPRLTSILATQIP
jgi:hypothetical protein